MSSQPRIEDEQGQERDELQRSPDALAVTDMCNDPGWRSQFGHPRGALGWLAGHLMARKNAAMNQAAVDLLEVGPRDAVLEIGFGHGRTVALLAERARDGFVAGVDPSATMLRQATRRNRQAIRDGRVELCEGEAARLPHADARFDKVLAVNSFQHWEHPDKGLEEVWRVLRPGGTLLLALRLHDEAGGRFSAPGFRAEQVEAAVRLVEAAGFGSVRQVKRTAGRDLVALLATA